jgi:hypothetical protein
MDEVVTLRECENRLGPGSDGYVELEKLPVLTKRVEEKVEVRYEKMCGGWGGASEEQCGDLGMAQSLLDCAGLKAQCEVYNGGEYAHSSSILPNSHPILQAGSSHTGRW